MSLTDDLKKAVTDSVAATNAAITVLNTGGSGGSGGGSVSDADVQTAIDMLNAATAALTTALGSNAPPVVSGGPVTPPPVVSGGPVTPPPVVSGGPVTPPTSEVNPLVLK